MEGKWGIEILSQTLLVSIVVGLYQFQRRKTEKDHITCVVQKQHNLRTLL